MLFLASWECVSLQHKWRNANLISHTNVRKSFSLSRSHYKFATEFIYVYTVQDCLMCIADCYFCASRLTFSSLLLNAASLHLAHCISMMLLIEQIE